MNEHGILIRIKKQDDKLIPKAWGTNWWLKLKSVIALHGYTHKSLYLEAVKEKFGEDLRKSDSF